MQTHTAPWSRVLSQSLAPAMAILLLSVLAVPAEAQRGSGRGGGSGHYSGHSGHRGGHGVGSHHRGRNHGYRHQGRGHSGYRGNNGYRGHSSYRGHRDSGFYGYYDFRGQSPYRNHYRHGRHSSYQGYYGHSGYYGSYNRSYAYYRSPRYVGFGYDAYPGVSVTYEAAPRYIVGGRSYAAPSYQSAIAIPERVVTEGDEPYANEPYSTTEPYDARPEPARVKLQVAPDDASVYLDGRFLGLASELPEELWIDPGPHRLEVARPGFTGRALDLDLEIGEALEVDARLEAEATVPDLHR